MLSLDDPPSPQDVDVVAPAVVGVKGDEWVLRLLVLCACPPVPPPPRPPVRIGDVGAGLAFLAFAAPPAVYPRILSANEGFAGFAYDDESAGEGAGDWV